MEMKHSGGWRIWLAVAAITAVGFLARRHFRTEPRSLTPASAHAPGPTPGHETAPAASTDLSSSAPAPGAVSETDPLLAGLNTDDVQRAPQITKLVEEMTGEKRRAALENLWAENITGARRELTTALLRKWAEESPESAAAWVFAKPPGELRHEGLRAVAISWANQNLTQAANWVRQWGDDEKDSGLLAVAYEAANTAPKEALWLASEIKPSASRDGLISHAVRNWASTDPHAPVAWAQKMDESILREEVLAAASVSLSQTDPAAAANLALENLPQGPTQDNTVVSIVQRWTQSNPTEAADWVAQFPEGRLRDAAIDNLVQNWSAKDSAQQITNWFGTLQPGGVRDSALAAYARKLAAATPQDALEWAQNISDAEQRQAQMQSVLRLWVKSDSKAATAWMQTSGVSLPPAP